jgi:hypothetical protein
MYYEIVDIDYYDAHHRRKGCFVGKQVRMIKEIKSQGDGWYSGSFEVITDCEDASVVGERFFSKVRIVEVGFKPKNFLSALRKLADETEAVYSFEGEDDGNRFTIILIYRSRYVKFEKRFTAFSIHEVYDEVLEYYKNSRDK